MILEVGLGKACEIAQDRLQHSDTKDLTDYFYRTLKKKFGEAIVLNGHPEKRLHNTLNISFLGHNGHEIMQFMKDIAVSTGSACHTGMTAISPVLKAMGADEETGRGAVRFSLGRYTTREELDVVVSRLSDFMDDN
ncbi:aminotransferase class V-fold PLP-dependent enzyme [Proteiniclasticum sp. C24MP]|uniref:aminotransferase class V-fold PLP-dependent enzyme n=1 Tax=Proteiniclasticum sp. C24MP TaxID=3374101 RepID=UPI003754F68E